MAQRKITPHALRHTIACQLVQAGIDINTIRAWLGHVSLDTTNVYAEIDLETEARAMEMCKQGEPGPGPPWKQDKGLIAFLNALCAENSCCGNWAACAAFTGRFRWAAT